MTPHPAEHELKTWPSFFTAIVKGKKTFEIRLHDRPYLVGDTLFLREYHPTDGYTGRSVYVTVTYMTTAQGLGLLNQDVVVMSIEPQDRAEREVVVTLTDAQVRRLRNFERGPRSRTTYTKPWSLG